MTRWSRRTALSGRSGDDDSTTAWRAWRRANSLNVGCSPSGAARERSNLYGGPRCRPFRAAVGPRLRAGVDRRGADEWRSLEQGLIQRAGLLNAVLADLYGRQTLMRDGHLPAAVV